MSSIAIVINRFKFQVKDLRRFQWFIQQINLYLDVTAAIPEPISMNSRLQIDRNFPETTLSKKSQKT